MICIDCAQRFDTPDRAAEAWRCSDCRTRDMRRGKASQTHGEAPAPPTTRIPEEALARAQAMRDAKEREGATWH